MVASVHPLATAAGLRVLRDGGNAVDAAVAVALTLGVVDPADSGIGGGCFMLIRRPDGSIAAIDGRETAPAAATRDMFLRDGKAAGELSQTGALAIGVPGELAACAYALEHFGSRSLRQLIEPAAGLAEEGFPLDPFFVRRVRSALGGMAVFPETRAVFLGPDGLPPREGERFHQPDLAATYRHVAAEGAGWFYGGPFARKVEGWMKGHGGLIRAADFAAYQVGTPEPIRTTYRGCEVAGFPPPSSGGVHVAQILNVLEGFDLKSMPEGTRLHVIAEAMKLAFADRAYWLGDPAFAKVPRGLIDPAYARALAARIDRERATPVPGHGTPPAADRALFGRHTTHFSVADAAGNWVACTATINTTFGSKVVIPGTGVVMNNEMDDFSIQPGATNYFGLIGGEANAVAPGKRPLSSMSPTIVSRGGRPILALGAAGGPTIISQVVLELVSLLDLEATPAEALRQPRIHHQWSPDEIVAERGLPEKLRQELIARGHHLRGESSFGTSQIISQDPATGLFSGAADPRAGGTAEGW